MPLDRLKASVSRGLHAVMNPFLVQLYFIFFTFLSEIPLIMQYVQFWKKIGLVWAALVIVYDLLTERRCLKARFALPAFGLLIAYFVTVVINRTVYPAAFQSNYLDLFCSVVTLLVLYPPTTNDPEKGMRRLGVINNMLFILTSIVALIGIGMFVVQYGARFVSAINEYDYPVGFVDNRLTGLYRNAIYPTSFIGIAAAVMQLTRRPRHWWKMLLLCISIFLNFFHICLAYSRGIFIALAVFAAVIVMFLVKKQMSRYGKPMWLRWGTGVLCAALSAVLVFGLIQVMRKGAAYVPSVAQEWLGIQMAEPMPNPDEPDPDEPDPDEPDPDEPDPDVTDPDDPSSSTQTQPTNPNQTDKFSHPITPIDLDRYIPSTHGTLTGRPIIWRLGLSYFAKKPIFGYGSYSLQNAVRISETSQEKLSHFHNIFLHSLVSVGVVGSLFFFALIALVGCRIIRRLFVEDSTANDTLFIVLSAFFAAMLVINMADTTLFFLSKNSEFVFWAYLGYAMLLIKDDRPSRLDAPMRRLDAACDHLKNRLTSRKER